MIATPAKITLDHPFFWYLEADAKKEIAQRIAEKKSRMVTFEHDGELVFAAVIDFDQGELLHLRECAGKFPKHYRYLCAFMTECARALGKKFISFTTKIEGVDIIGRKLGFHADASGDRIKAI